MPFTSRLLSTFMVEYQTQFYWNFAWIIFFSVVVVGFCCLSFSVFSFFFFLFFLERIQMLCDVLLALLALTLVITRSMTFYNQMLHGFIYWYYHHIHSTTTTKTEKHTHTMAAIFTRYINIVVIIDGLVCVCVSFCSWLLQMILSFVSQKV